MDEIKRITDEQLRDISAQRGFNIDLLLKDYYITVILNLIRNINGIYFKGGTALQKILLNYSRLSEDIDLTLTRDIEQIKNEIISTLESSQLFSTITLDRNQSSFIRIVVYYNKNQAIFIDLNQKATLLKQSTMHEVTHFYPENIPSFSFPILAFEEMIAEKVRAAIQRNKPRDHFDIYQIITLGMRIDLDLVKRKCEEAQVKFDLTKMFNKAQKLKKRWDEDLIPLIKEEVSFKEVMKTLADYFKLKQEKKKNFR